MDRIDKRILDILQYDSQISNQDLAELDPGKLGLPLTIIVSVGLTRIFHDTATTSAINPLSSTNEVKNIRLHSVQLCALLFLT